MHCTSSDPLSVGSRSVILDVVVGSLILLVFPKRTHLPPDLHDPRADATPVNAATD